MLDKLTDEQIRLMHDVKNEYVHLLEKRTDDKDVIEGIKFAYKISRLGEPNIQIFDSPFACQLFLNRRRLPQPVTQRIEQQMRQQTQQSMLWIQQVEPQILHEVERIARNEVFRQVDQLVRQQVFRQVDQQVRYKVEQQVGRQQAMDYCQANIDNMLTCHQVLSVCDYFERIGIAKNDIPNEYKKYFRSGIFSSMYLDGLAVVSRNPLRLSRDDKERLHSREGYAIEWADGYGQNYVNGVFFELDLFDKIFIKKNVTGKDIFNLRNIEQKAISAQFFGYDKLIDELGAKKIDSYKVKNEYTGIESVSELYNFEIDDRNGDWRRSILRGRFVKVQDHSTGKITVLGVPVIKETENVKGAIAWTFNMAKDEYNFVVET